MKKLLIVLILLCAGQAWGAENYQTAAGTVAANFATGQNWTVSGTGATLTMRTDIKLAAFDRSMQLTTAAGAGSLARGNYTTANIEGIEAAGYFVVAVYPLVVTTSDVIRMILYDGSDSPDGYFTNYTALRLNAWNYIYIKGSSFSPAPSGLTQQYMRLQITSGQGGSSVIFGGAWYVPAARPKIVITWDDNFSSQYSQAYSYMASQSIPGSVYVIGDKINATGYCTHQQLSEMYHNGWDMLVHGNYTHTTDLGSDSAAISADIIANREYLARYGWFKGIQHYAYPGGAIASSSTSVLDSLGFKTSRTTLFGEVSTAPLGVDQPFKILASPINTTVSIATIQGRIDDAISLGCTLFLYGHKVVASVTDNNNEISVANFQTLIDYIKTKIDANLIDAMTVSDWYNGLAGLSTENYKLGRSTAATVYNSALVSNDANYPVFLVDNGETRTLKNSIVYHADGGSVIKVSAGEDYPTSDYNIYYSSSSTPFDDKGTLKNLADWRTASSQDANSVVIDPKFINLGVDTFGTNVTVNGGFETAGGGGTDVWGTWNESTTLGTSTISADNTTKVSGTYSAKMVRGDTEVLAWSFVTVTPSTYYEVSFWTKGDGSVGGQWKLYDQTAGANIVAQSATGITAATWTKHRYRFTTGAATVSLRLFIYAPVSAGTAWFDDLKLEPITVGANYNLRLQYTSPARNAGTALFTRAQYLANGGDAAGDTNIYRLPDIGAYETFEELSFLPTKPFLDDPWICPESSAACYVQP